MKIVVQRVKNALVKIRGKSVGKIGPGLLLLVGIQDGDPTSPFDKTQGFEGASRVKEMAEKILKLRIFSDEKDKMNLSIQDVKGEILVVSQFTLLADCSGGNRPYFGTAAKPEIAEPILKSFINELKKSGLKVETGVFGAKMEVELVNDGPVTIIIEQEVKRAGE